MRTLLWAEYRKIRRSKIIRITVFAVLMTALLILVEGQRIHDGPVVHYGLKSVLEGSRYIDNAGWYMDEAQPLATFFVLPAVIALLGSYLISREEDEGTLKYLRLIPINETKLTAAKMIVAFLFSIFLYLLLFAITFFTEAVLHLSDLTAELILLSLKEYILSGAGVFFAVSPVIALVSRIKKGYWTALVFTEIYSMGGLFAGMSNVLKTIYPIMAIFQFSGYHITTSGKIMVSTIVLLLCVCFSVVVLRGLNYRE